MNRSRRHNRTAALILRLVLSLAVIWQGALPVMARAASADGSLISTIICGANGPEEILFDLTTGAPAAEQDQQQAPSRCPDCTTCCLVLDTSAPGAVGIVARIVGDAPVGAEGRDAAPTPRMAAYAARAPPAGSV